MNLSRVLRSPHCLLLGALLTSAAASGCQTTMNGQTLPSANYLRDDIQYFPAGPEFKLYNQERAIREWQAQQAGVEAEGLPEAPPPVPASP
ncbi:MAG: hypothetical protein U0992_07575 [Planctomycetaceae bacterium]